MQRFLSFTFFILFFSFLNAQEFGGNPPSIKWKQINTDTARIIFPVGMDSSAQRAASIVHFLAAKNNLLGNKVNKINIVLQNQSTIANAYVGLGPYRSEFFLTPSFNSFELGSIPWVEDLASHEYRHVQQYSNFRVGLSKLMYYLAGDDGLALAINAAVPDWFYEGDAVYNETVHSEQGRGRIPFFTNQYKSLWLDNKQYSWMKLRNGSLKDYVPNHYPLGYLMVNYGYEKYGTDFWGKVTKDAASYKSLFYPFQNAIKKHAGVDYKTFRKQAFDHYKLNSDIQQKSATQEKSDSSTEAGEQKIINPTLGFVTNYFFPYQTEDGSLLYLKGSYRKRPAFVIKDNSGEHVLRVKDISLDEQYSYRNGKIVYSAYKPDARWGWRNYGEIRLLDVKSGNQQTITHKTKYFTPDINNDGSKIVAVNYQADGKCGLHLLDATSGSLLKNIESSEINVFTDPKFIDDNSIIACARFRDGQMSLVRADISGSITRLTPPSYHVIGFPNVQNDKVYFTASFDGNDEVFMLQLNDKKIFQVSKSSTGNYFVNAFGNKLVYSNFTADGYQLKEISIDKIALKEIEPSALESPANHFPIAKESDYSGLGLKDISTRNFQTNKYKKGTRLLNFHSWRPYYEDPLFTYTLYGQNVLNTLQTEVYYLYNQDENTNAVGFNTTYGAWFPYLSAGAEYTFKRTDTLNNTTREWNQLDTRIGLNIPLDLSGGRSFRNLNFGSSYVFRFEYNTGPNKDLFGENNFSYLSHFINYSQQLQMARQHIFPRLGYNFSLQYRHAISKYDSYQFFGSGHIYLPGFFSNHSVVLDGAFQQRDTFRLLFSNRFPYSRGYNETYLSRMWKVGANYHFPLWVPDWGFGNILYIQRIRANAFYDFTRVYSKNKTVTADQRSVGGEIYFDTNWWNQYPLTFGFRISSRLDADLVTRQKGTFYEFILPVSIIPR
ncbi:MAG TPA: hypothetical protein VFU29_02020 [Chitinophagaceae bacterium]|nr:hypothetical protein [Chitinophagaceae bacterium]